MPSTEDQFPTHYVDEKTVLPNGVTVVTRAVNPAVYHPHNTRIALNLTAGSAHAESGKMHFLEHTSAHKGHELIWTNFGQKNGYSFSGTSAGTGENLTTFGLHDDYGTNVVVGDLDPALRMHLSLVKNPDNSQDNVEYERRLILEEIRGYNPWKTRWRNFRSVRLNNMLPNGNIGTEDDVQLITPKDLSDTHDKLYVGKNMVVFMLLPYRSDAHRLHEGILNIVEQELGNISSGHQAQTIFNPPQNSADLRLNGRLLSDSKNGYIEIALASAPKYSPESAAVAALHELYSIMFMSAVRKIGVYHYNQPQHDQSDFAPALLTSFQAANKTIRPIFNIVKDTLGLLATSNIEELVENYKKSKAKQYLQSYRTNEDAFLSLREGYLYAGKPMHPDQFYIGAANLKTSDVIEAARRLIHNPISIRADIGTDGDPEGKYVPFVAEFAEKLRAGVPKPEAPVVGGNLDFLSRRSVHSAPKLEV